MPDKPDFIDATDIPVTYGRTRITLIPRDPFWIYAWWEVTGIDLAGAGSGSKLVLRVYDITCINFNASNANHSFDIEVGPRINNWHINLWVDNTSYCAEIGVRGEHSRFRPLARSNFVNTPRAKPSQRNEQVWMGLSAKTGTRRIIERAKNITHIPRPAKRIYLTENDIRSYYAAILGLHQRRNNGGRLFRLRAGTKVVLPKHYFSEKNSLSVSSSEFASTHA